MQVRGSIPLFWHQEGGGSRLKPDILLQQYDPLYSTTRQHVDDLRHRYGDFRLPDLRLSRGHIWV